MTPESRPLWIKALASLAVLTFGGVLFWAILEPGLLRTVAIILALVLGALWLITVIALAIGDLLFWRKY